MQIPLTNGGHVTVDPDFYEDLSRSKWRRTSNVVKRTTWSKETKRPVTESLSSVLMGPPAPGHVWYHDNGDSSDFRRENLKLSTIADNPNRVSRLRSALQSRSEGFTGVYPKNGRSMAACSLRGEQTYLGLFATPEQAAYAYDLALQSIGLETKNHPSLSDEERASVEAKVRPRLVLVAGQSSRILVSRTSFGK